MKELLQYSILGFDAVETLNNNTIITGALTDTLPNNFLNEKYNKIETLVKLTSESSENIKSAWVNLGVSVGVNLRIQTEYEKIRPRKNFVSEHFYAASSLSQQHRK